MEYRVATVAVAVVLLLVAGPLGALIGAVSAYMVGLVWGDGIIGTLRAIGLPERVTMWDLGATLGFVSAFIRPTTSQRRSDD